MELGSLIEALSDPGAYPYLVPQVDVCQTHISVVFLAGPYAYKIKKPVDMGFLDFKSLERRRHFCEQEVRLNRRLAPSVYLGVVPVSRRGSTVYIDSPGELIEWAVKMERLPEEAMLQRRLQRGAVSPELLQLLARRIADFHAHAERNSTIAAFGGFDVVARNARENFEQAAAQVGTTVSAVVFDRLRSLSEQSLQRLRPSIEARAARGMPCDAHGDLHLDHVYYFPDRQAPADLVIVDCIEFNERFRCCDPVADMAFLVMDLQFHGRRDLAEAFRAAYFRFSGDEEGPALLPFYTAYRAIVRGKVEGFELAEKEIPEPDRVSARVRARAHWLLALGELEEPGQQPCLVLVGGLPGTGKSTLARQLAERLGFQVIRTDVVRKELAGDLAARADGYTAEWTERTYAECRRRAEKLLFEGKRVLVDASFRERRRRQQFLQTAIRCGVPGIVLLCRAEPDVVRARLDARRNDASDANWRVYCQLAKEWQEPLEEEARSCRDISSSGAAERTYGHALAALREAALHMAAAPLDGPKA